MIPINPEKWKYVLLFILMLALSGCGKQTTGIIISTEQLDAPNKKIGVETGTTAMFEVEENLPNADMQQFSDKYLGYLAVEEGKIDAFAFERLQMELAIKNGQNCLTKI